VFNSSTQEKENAMWSFIIFLLIGALAGWLAGRILKGDGFGTLGNIIVGVLGAIVGGFVFTLLGMTSTNMIGEIISATVGAIILLFLIDKVQNR
jgi:uncharacterized membrane protein YeaQ/YmgE (transglycosylase-associated protein family)